MTTKVIFSPIMKISNVSLIVKASKRVSRNPGRLKLVSRHVLVTRGDV